MNKDIQHIIQGCLKQDRKSQHELYKLFYSYGMSIAIRYVNNENEAISLLNDSFMKVFNKINRFDSNHDFKPWFRKILVNTALDYLKSQKRLIMNKNIDDVHHISDRENILSKISYKELLGMIKNLSQGYRTVFNLYAIDGFKHEEIAEKLNISIGTSKSNLHKARKSLQIMVQQQLKLEHA